jgi:hypothetical protein
MLELSNPRSSELIESKTMGLETCSRLQSDSSVLHSYEKGYAMNELVE